MGTCDGRNIGFVTYLISPSSCGCSHLLSLASFVLVEGAWDFVARFLLSSQSILTYLRWIQRGVSTESSYLFDVVRHRRSGHRAAKDGPL